MPRCILFLWALLPAALTLPASAQLADPQAQPVPAAATELPAAGTPAMTNEQKLEQYRHDQINLLALRPDAESLLAATLLADADADDKRRPASLKSPALLKRAQSIGAESSIVWLVTAAADCHAAPKACPSVEVLQKLESLDAENAAVWLLALWHAQQANDAPAARAALTSAAQAKHYNDYFGALVNAIFHAQEVLPMSNELLNASGADASVDGFRLLTAASIALSKVSLPGGSALREACKPVEPADSSVVADCIAVAQKLESSGSLFARGAGLTLHETLLASGPDLDALRAQKRALAWQMQSMGDLAGRLANEQRVTRTYLDALAESRDETAAVSAVLRSQGISREPPPGWQPPASAPAPQP